MFKKSIMTETERVKLIDTGLRHNEVVLEPEVIQKVIHVVDVITRNADSATLKSLKYQ